MPESLVTFVRNTHQEHRKPIFNLTSADGAIGSHYGAVQDAKKDFRQLAEKIAEQIGMAI